VTGSRTADFLLVVVPLVALGVVAAVQEIRARRWDAGFFREGIAVFHEAIPVAHAPREVPLPGVRATRLNAYEIAFFAPVLNGSLMRGLLRYSNRSGSLEVIGHLQWGLWALMSTLAFAGLPFALAMGLLIGWAYLGERRRFSTVLLDARRSLGSDEGVEQAHAADEARA
jgi:hypothetical protein